MLKLTKKELAELTSITNREKGAAKTLELMNVVNAEIFINREQFFKRLNVRLGLEKGRGVSVNMETGLVTVRDKGA